MAVTNSTEDYQVLLTLQHRVMRKDFWRVRIICPNGHRIETMAWSHWGAKLQARWIVWRHRHGLYSELRESEAFAITHSGGGWRNR
jgi:lysyl-tRNA synthetase class I